MDKLMLIRSLKKSKQYLTEKFGIEQIGLFGSYAKGQQSFGSDVDLVFHLKSGSKIKLAKLIELEKFLAGLFQNKKIDLVNGQYINPLIKLNMEKTVVYV